MNINKLSLYFLVFLLSILKNSFIKSSELKPSQDYMFLLLFSDEKDENFYFLKFGLTSLKKCHFPSGPSISNELCINEPYKIKKEIWEMLHNSSINLSMFCIEEPLIDLSGQIKCIRKCGFELPSDKSLSYLFDLDNNFHNIKGIIILTSEFEKILNDEQSELFDEPFVCPIPDDPEDIKNIDGKKLEEFIKKPDSKFVKFLKVVGGPLLTKYYATSDFIVKYKKRLMIFLKNGPFVSFDKLRTNGLEKIDRARGEPVEPYERS